MRFFSPRADGPAPSSRLRSRGTRRLLLAAALALGAVAPAAVEAPAPRRLTFAELAACPLVAPGADEPKARWAQSLSAPVRAADGQRVVLTGYMLPLAVERGRTRQFLLMRNQNTCCFGQTPSANEYLVADCAAPGVPVQMDLPVAIEGRLHVAPLFFGGALVQFYTLDEAVAAPAGAAP